MTHQIHIQPLQPSSFNQLGIDWIHHKSITLMSEKSSSLMLSLLSLLAWNLWAAQSTDERCETRFMETLCRGWACCLNFSFISLFPTTSLDRRPARTGFISAVVKTHTSNRLGSVFSRKYQSSAKNTWTWLHSQVKVLPWTVMQTSTNPQFGLQKCSCCC